METLLHQIREVSIRTEVLTERTVKARRMLELLMDDVPVYATFALVLPSGDTISLEKLPFSYVAVGNGSMAFLSNVVAQLSAELAKSVTEGAQLIKQLEHLEGGHSID